MLHAIARHDPLTKRRPEENVELVTALRGMIATGMQPSEVNEHVLTAIRDERFYVFTHPQYEDGIRARCENLIAKRNPAPPTLSQAAPSVGS